MPELAASVVDPNGREVMLDDDAWQHIATRHDEMSGSWLSVLAAIANPDHREPAPRPVENATGAEGSAPLRGWWWS